MLFSDFQEDRGSPPGSGILPLAPQDRALGQEPGLCSSTPGKGQMCKREAVPKVGPKRAFDGAWMSEEGWAAELRVPPWLGISCGCETLACHLKLCLGFLSFLTNAFYHPFS